MKRPLKFLVCLQSTLPHRIGIIIPLRIVPRFDFHTQFHVFFLGKFCFSFKTASLDKQQTQFNARLKIVENFVLIILQLQ